MPNKSNVKKEGFIGITVWGNTPPWQGRNGGKVVRQLASLCLSWKATAFPETKPQRMQGGLTLHVMTLNLGYSFLCLRVWHYTVDVVFRGWYWVEFRALCILSKHSTNSYIPTLFSPFKSVLTLGCGARYHILKKSVEHIWKHHHRFPQKCVSVVIL